MSTVSEGKSFLEKIATRAFVSLVNIVLLLSTRMFMFLGQSLDTVGERNHIKHRIKHKLALMTFLKQIALYTKGLERPDLVSWLEHLEPESQEVVQGKPVIKVNAVD